MLVRAARTPLTLALCSAAALVSACGSNVPSIEEVKSGFASPSGSTSDTRMVIAAQQKQQAADPATRVAGNGAAIGFGLTAEGKPRGLTQLRASELHKRQIARLKAFIEGRQHQALEAGAGFHSGCANEEAVNEAARDLLVNALLGSASASFSYEVDLTACTGGELTGRMEVDGEIELEKNSFRFALEQTLENVCETGGDKACVDGTFAVEIAAEADGSGSASKLEFTTALFATASWDQGGTRRTAETRGGMRASADDMGNASLEILVFVRDASGEEYTFVLKASARADGSSSLSVRGKDGELSCDVDAMGAGTCTGTGTAGGATVTWSVEDVASVLADKTLMGS